MKDKKSKFHLTRKLKDDIYDPFVDFQMYKETESPEKFQKTADTLTGLEDSEIIKETSTSLTLNDDTTIMKKANKKKRRKEKNSTPIILNN